MVLLGTGAADGWPNAFCRCDSCTGAREVGVHRAPTSVLLDGRILLDLGPQIEGSAARAGVDLADLAAGFVTHAHEDHCAPAALLHRTWVTDAPLLLHGPPAVIAACAPWLDPAGSPITLVEVGAMDTEWATAGMQFSTPIPAYDELRKRLFGTAVVPWPSEPGATGGGSSPEAIAEEVLAHVAAQEGPLRLVLGEGAADQIRVVLDQRHQDYACQPGFQVEG